MAADAGRDLLFGLLALQNGLIDQGQLVAAFQAWTRDKGRRLADYLLERGDLEPDDRSAVEAMVDRHLRKHGGDTEKSLASIPAGRSTREKLRAIEDADLDATLAHVPSGSTEQDADATSSYSVGSSTADGLRFRVLRPHARGGLGAVFVALDDELNREVALKQLLENHADEPLSRQRFLLEAEITGGLEHPGIVPVYGLGAYRDGRPYYAMRFIRGDSLKDAIAAFHADATLKADDGARSLALRKLLRRFADVCNAIEYAHSRGVLHRDIKPGNIIVGKHGETLVVDWGLAKPLGQADPSSDERTLLPSSASGSAETLPGSAVGTPAYMSPEQARGDLGALGPRADVYSLGATLFALLTGRAPFQGDDLGAVLRQVRLGAFPPPRQLDPAIDKPLEAICLKAMALDPGHRYPSSRALADDLDRWLADEPVDAYPEPWTRTLSRRVARHRTAVAGSAAALLVGLIGLSSVAAVQTQGRNALAAKNRELTGANARLADSNAALDLQRQRAEDREGQAIDAVKRFRDAVVDNPALKDSPELEGLRKTLLKEPLAFFRALSDQLQAERDTRPAALIRLAEAVRDYAHLTDEIGDPQDGLDAHDEGLAIWEALTRADPANPEYLSGLATIQNCRGNLQKEIGEPEAARRAYEAALAIRRRLADDHPAVTAYQSDLANSHNHLGHLLRATGEREAARQSHEAALAIWRRLADDHPAVTDYQSGLARSHNNLGSLLRETGEPEPARSAYEAALAIQRRLAGDHPAVTQYQSELARSHNNFGILLREAGEPESARRSYEAALAIQRRLADDHPAVTRYQKDLAHSHDNLGTLLSATGEPESARGSYEAALAIRRRLTVDHPESPDNFCALGATLNNLATIDLPAQRFAEARDLLREAIVWQEKALATNTRNPTYRQFLTNHYMNLQIAARGLGDPILAAEAQQGLAELQASDPQVQALNGRLAAILGGDAPTDNAERLALALHAYNINRFAAAARLWAEALDDDPTLAESRQALHAYNAACSAALASAGQGDDTPEDDARSPLRGRCLGWLRDELGTWSALLEGADAEQAGVVAANLRHWQADPDLDSVRGPDALARLPEEERAAFEALWDEVADLLAHADAETSPLPEDPFAR